MTSIMVMMILMVISTSMMVMRMIGMIGMILMLKYLDVGDLVRNQLLRNHKGMWLSPLIGMKVLVMLKWKGLEK